MSLRPAGRRPNLPATIANRLRAQIVSGVLPPGSRLPGHRDLATTHAVSVGSMRPSVESHRFVLGLYALGHSTEAAGG